jgi:hypothetical protein
MQKILFVFALCMLAFAGNSVAQSIEGNWYVTGDAGPKAVAKHANKDFAVVEIKKQASDGTYFAVVKESMNSLATKCQNCPGENSGRNTVGMTIAKGFKQSAGKNDEWEAGWAINPETGKEATSVKGKMSGPNNLDLIITDAAGASRTLKLRRKN